MIIIRYVFWLNHQLLSRAIAIHKRFDFIIYAKPHIENESGFIREVTVKKRAELKPVLAKQNATNCYVRLVVILHNVSCDIVVHSDTQWKVKYNHFPISILICIILYGGFLLLFDGFRFMYGCYVFDILCSSMRVTCNVLWFLISGNIQRKLYNKGKIITSTQIYELPVQCYPFCLYSYHGGKSREFRDFK